MSALKYLGVVVVGMMAGLIAGAMWGWLGSGDYEAGDSAIGTGLLGAVAGGLIAAIFGSVFASRQSRRER